MSTIFVIGAGASCEAGLPVGRQLTANIAQLLDMNHKGYNNIGTTDPVIEQAIRNVGGSAGAEFHTNELIQAGIRIRDAMPLAASIDTFIDANRSSGAIAFCGKLAIVLAVLRAERECKLAHAERGRPLSMNPELAKDLWYARFFQKLTAGCSAQQLADRFAKVTLVIFNYDRCVEHFLYHSLQITYGMNHQQTVEVLSAVKIFHPYGSAGRLRWTDNAQAMDFGGEPNSGKLVDLAASIKTFTEELDPASGSAAQIRSLVAKCEKLIFLGFAFHRLNMDLLAPAKQSTTPKRYLSTGLGISSSDAEVIRAELQSNIGLSAANDVAVGKTCTQLFEDYSRSLDIV